jgi:hypothetical protein
MNQFINLHVILLRIYPIYTVRMRLKNPFTRSFCLELEKSLYQGRSRVLEPKLGRFVQVFLLAFAIG